MRSSDKNSNILAEFREYLFTTVYMQCGTTKHVGKYAYHKPNEVNERIQLTTVISNREKEETKLHLGSLGKVAPQNHKIMIQNYDWENSR